MTSEGAPELTSVLPLYSNNNNNNNSNNTSGGISSFSGGGGGSAAVASRYGVSECVYRGDRNAFNQVMDNNNNHININNSNADNNDNILVDGTEHRSKLKQSALLRSDVPNMILLIVLYLVQGVPLGLAFGSVPFLLQQKLSYTQLGFFSLASYPYSLKLLWSPIVDAVYSDRIGRRKSWIIPIQTCSALLLYYLGQNMSHLVESGESGVWATTVSFFSLVMLAATQDIAVDGWAITILAKENISYASTCQTVGLNAGYFMSFTIFLALNSPEFCNTYLRSTQDASPYGMIEVGQYMQLWAGLYLALTLWLLLFKKEQRFVPSAEDDLSISGVYRMIWRVIKLPNMRDLTLVLFICKFGFAVSDNVTSLALLDRGFRKEHLALFALIDFPLQILYAIIAGKLSSGAGPLNPWLRSYQVRLGVALASMLMVYYYPIGDMSPLYFIAVLLVHLASSFASTMMMVSQGSFFARISDSSIGGTYLTLLNTVANLGGTWPKFFILLLVDMFSESRCVSVSTGETLPIDCRVKTLLPKCLERGGQCEREREGYFPVGFMCLLAGVVLYFFLRTTLRRLQALQESSWTLSSISTSEQGESDGARARTEGPMAALSTLPLPLQAWARHPKRGIVFNA